MINDDTKLVKMALQETSSAIACSIVMNTPLSKREREIIVSLYCDCLPACEVASKNCLSVSGMHKVKEKAIKKIIKYINKNPTYKTLILNYSKSV